MFVLILIDDCDVAPSVQLRFRPPSAWVGAGPEEAVTVKKKKSDHVH